MLIYQEFQKIKRVINREYHCLGMKKGDLVFFETTGQGRISHVGIYMGERQFIHASSGGKRVMVSSLDTDYYNKSFRWGVDPLT